MSKLMIGLLVIGAAAMAGAQEEKVMGWKNSAGVGLTMTDGNSETLVANASAKSEHTAEAGILTLGIEGNYGEADDEKNVENAKALANYKRTYDAFYAYLDGNVLYDDIAAIDYRATVGPGLGKFLVDSDKTKLGIEAGVAYIFEDVADVTEDYAALRLAQNFSRQISETAKIFESVEYLPEIEDFDNYLLNGEVGIEAAINSSASIRVSVKDKYDSTPGEGLEENDVSLIAALSFIL
ncbi:MAG: YdiY family protein [Kiritimatiellia bacterium]